MTIQLSDHFNYKRLIRFVLPSVIMMVFTSIYGVVDGLFVSNIAGKAAFAAINLVMPLDMICGGVGFMLGAGGSALVAKTLGEKKTELANRYFTMMICITFIIGVIVSLIGVAVMRPASVFLGADDEMLPNCVAYGRVIMAFNAAFMLQNAFQGFFVTAEKPSLGLKVTVVAGITNMALDALFVGALKLGVAGAALATGISQCVGGIIPLIYFIKPNDSPLKLVKTKLELAPILKACANGSSEMVSSVTSSVIGIVYNFQLLTYAGQNGVAAYGALMYVQFALIAIFIGYSIGVAPVISYHYGANNTDELKSLLKKSSALTIGLGAITALAAQFLAVTLANIFVGYDADLLNMTVRALRISSLAFITAGFNIFASSFFTALNNGGVSAAISFLRTFIFKLAAVLLLPLIWELDGVWLADALAEIFAFLLSVFFLINQRNKYRYFGS